MNFMLSTFSVDNFVDYLLIALLSRCCKRSVFKLS